MYDHNCPTFNAVFVPILLTYTDHAITVKRCLSTLNVFFVISKGKPLFDKELHAYLGFLISLNVAKVLINEWQLKE